MAKGRETKTPVALGAAALGNGLVAPAPAPDSRRVVKTSDTVALNIVHDIMARGLKPGDRLPLEAAMLQQYRVSRASLREALRLLEVQGLISLKPGPGGGPVVGNVNAEYLARTATLYFQIGGMTYGQLFAAQEELEPACAGQAARHPDRKARMRPFIEQAPDEHAPDYHPATRQFHQTVYQLAGNEVLTLFTSAITHIISSHIVSTMDPVELRAEIIEEHQELARAIGAGQETKARRLMREHFKAQHDWYRRNWPARLNDVIEWR